MHRRVQLLILQVLHPRLDQVIFRDGKMKLERRVGLFGCAKIFFGTGWMDIVL